ncbi:ERF family protein [Listeria monocytogenes]
MTLDEKLLELKQEVMIMQKDGKGYGYDYVSEENILNKINQKMIDLKIRLTPRFVAGTLASEIINYKDAKGKDKTDVLVRSELVYEWKDVQTGEVELIPWGLIGQQSDASQALGSGLTYTNRYFLLKFFNIQTSNDDPDKIKAEKQKEEERKKLNATQTKIKKLFNELITKHQKAAVIYELLGTNKEQFTKDFSDKEKCNHLLEQMELINKEGE